MKYIKNQFIKSSQENSEVINFLFAPRFSYEYKGDNLDDFDNYFTDDVLNIEDVNSSLVSIVDKFLSSNTIKLEDKLAEQVSEISVSWNKEDFNLVVECELAEGVIAEEILPELKEVIIDQVAKNMDSEEIGKQEVFAVKSDEMVEFFSDKDDAEKRVGELESESYEVVEGEVTIFVSFDELKSAVVNEKAITSKRKIQSNTVTSTLPPALDIFLKDLAQMKGLFDYEDITDFSKRATDGDLKELKKLRQQANEAAEYDDEEDLERIAKNVSKIILKSSKQIKSSIYVDTDKLWEIADRYNTSRPVSGDWNTETEHELNTISKELGISKQEAKNLMIRELGFDDSVFSGVNSSRQIKSSQGSPKTIGKTRDEFIANVERDLGMGVVYDDGKAWLYLDDGTNEYEAEYTHYSGKGGYELMHYNVHKTGRSKVESSRKILKSAKYYIECGDSFVEFDDLREANEAFRQAVENNDSNTTVKIYVDEGYSNKHLKLMRSERGMLAQSHKAIKSEHEEIDRTFSNEVSFPSEEYKKWKKEAIKTGVTIVPDYSSDLELVYAGNKHIGTYNTWDEVLFCDDVGLFGHYLENSKQIKSGYRRNRYNNPDFNNDRTVFDYDVDNISVDEDVPFASEPIDPSWVGAEEHDEDYYHYRDMGEMYGSGVRSSKELSDKNSKQIKSDYSDEEYWYPETKKVWTVYAMNPRTGNVLGKWTYSTEEDAKERIQGWRRTATFHYWIKEEEEKIQSSRQIKSGVNIDVLECEKDIQKLADYLYDIGRSDLVHEIDDDFDNDPPEDEKSYIRKVKTWCDWRESPLIDKLEKDEWQEYLDSIKSSRQIKSSTWNDESFAERIVDELNKYADETYNDTDSEFTKKYGKLFNFKYRVEDDGTVVIYDNQGVLDLFDEDNAMAEFIRKKCKEMGGYCEPYDSSASFTIASSKQIKSDWEKVDMASGPIWDSPDGYWRIFEKNGKWVLRNLKYPQTKDCFYNSFEEASQKAEDIDFVIDDEVYKRLEENPDIDVESVYEKVARKVIETESFFHK